MVKQTLAGFIEAIESSKRIVHIEVRPDLPFALAKQDAFDKQFESDPAFRMRWEASNNFGGN